MKKLLIYLSVIGLSLAVLPIQAEAGSRDKKKYGYWGRHHRYYTRAYYRHYHPHHYWRYPFGLPRFGRLQDLNDQLDRFSQIGVLFGVDAFERHPLSGNFPDTDRHFLKACCRF
jgi:hypothetical protein